MQIKSYISFYIMLIRNIIFQGIFYMSFGEKLYKISITLIFFIFFNLIIDSKVIAFLLAHITNYVINGQFYVVYRYFDPSNGMNEKNLRDYLIFLNDTVRKFGPQDVLMIGGFSRGFIKKTSDLDLRIFHESTLNGSIKAYMMASYLRFYGLLKKFPIDVFCFSDISFLNKIREDEIPVNFKQNKEILKRYPSSKNYKDQLKNVTFIQ